MRESNSGGGGVDTGVLAGIGVLLVGAAGIVGAAHATRTTIGPIIAGSVAIVVAFITWYATDRRQKRELNAEWKRLAETQNAERHRHDNLLRHERQLADVADMRRVLEHALGTVNMSWTAALDVYCLPAGDHASGELMQRIVKLEKDLDASIVALDLRLGSKHPVRTSFGTTLDALNHVRTAASNRDGAGWATHKKSFDYALVELVAAAQRLIGADLPEQAPAGRPARVSPTSA
jgi:hypothetical protein